MADLTWAPEVVEAVGRAIYDHQMSDSDPLAVLIHCSDYVPEDGGLPVQIERTRRICEGIGATALSASPLPDALDLIQRMLDGRQGARADARAFLARVRGA